MFSWICNIYVYTYFFFNQNTNQKVKYVKLLLFIFKNIRKCREKTIFYVN